MILFRKMGFFRKENEKRIENPQTDAGIRSGRYAGGRSLYFCLCGRCARRQFGRRGKSEQRLYIVRRSRVGDRQHGDDEIYVGNWDGDGADTLCVRRGNVYYIKNSVTSGEADSVITYGKTTDTVFAGRWKK